MIREPAHLRYQIFSDGKLRTPASSTSDCPIGYQGQRSRCSVVYELAGAIRSFSIASFYHSISQYSFRRGPDQGLGRRCGENPQHSHLAPGSASMIPRGQRLVSRDLSVVQSLRSWTNSFHNPSH